MLSVPASDFAIGSGSLALLGQIHSRSQTLDLCDYCVVTATDCVYNGELPARSLSHVTQDKTGEHASSIVPLHLDGETASSYHNYYYF